MKVIVAHPGRQHSFRVAKALKDAGLLYKYATTVYNKDSSMLMRFVKLFLCKDNYVRAQRRKCASLVDDDVIQFCELEGILLLALIRIDKSSKFSNAYNEYISKKFQRKLAKYIIRNNVDMVISYDTNSTVLFSTLKEKAPSVIRVMDNAAPNRHYMYHDFLKHSSKCGVFGQTLEVYGYLTNHEKAKTFGEETKLAHYHIVASDYSQKALEFEGINSKQIYKIPYGVSEDFFKVREKTFSKNHLSCVYVGQFNQLKGIAQVLNAAKELNNPDILFMMVGGGEDAYRHFLSEYENHVTFCGYVLKEQLINIFETSHVFVFPTMGEGFGLVLLEAMAAGLVPITTRNCGGADIVNDGENGFLIEVGDTKALINKILWCKEHSAELDSMSHKAVETARQFTWYRYEKGIVEAVLKIAKKELYYE